MTRSRNEEVSQNEKKELTPKRDKIYIFLHSFLLFDILIIRKSSLIYPVACVILMDM